MPVGPPEKFELSTLEQLSKSIDNPQTHNIRKSCAAFAALSLVLFAAVYWLHGKDWIPPYWLYVLCTLSGTFLAGAAITNSLASQSSILVRYIDKAAVAKRIAELKTQQPKI